ncbi:MAG: Zn-dependent exopeptidase M28 [Tissierellia bacterium]|nr:Zn-dependent exopeptidase M28 [Tissierellia bacterium]
MKINKKCLAILLLIFLVVFSSSCSKFLGTKVEINQNDDKNKVEQEDENTSKFKFNTISETQGSLDQIGTRLIGTEGNYLIVEQLKGYFNNYPDVEILSIPYSINLYDEYKVSVIAGGESIAFDSLNSISKLINDVKFNESVIITDTLDGLDKLLNYIFITDSEKLIEISKEYSNVCLSLLAVDQIFLGQNEIKVKTNIPTIMNVDKATAEKLLNIKGQNAELKIEANRKDVNLENVYAVIKGKENSDAIVITSHIDTTTALGNNYSKGAIDNGSGISLNLDLFKKLNESKNQSNYDVIFALVNSEEGFLTRSSSGSMQLSASLSFKYDNVININLDCLGEKNIDLLSYGYDGKINGSKLTEIISKQNIDKFTLVLADYYTSDNLSFDNTIYFYNFDYHGENRAIHTERDNIDNIDIDCLESISDILFNVLTELLKLPKEELLK